MQPGDLLPMIQEIVVEYLDNEARYVGNWRTVTPGDVAMTKIAGLLHERICLNPRQCPQCKGKCNGKV